MGGYRGMRRYWNEYGSIFIKFFTIRNDILSINYVLRFYKFGLSFFKFKYIKNKTRVFTYPVYLYKIINLKLSYQAVLTNWPLLVMPK